MGIRIRGGEVLREVFRILKFADVMKKSHGPAGAGVGRPGGGSGGLRQMADENTMEVGAGRLESEAAEDGPVQAHEFEPGEVGDAIKDGLENRQQSADDDRAEQPKGGSGDGFRQDDLPGGGEGQAGAENRGKQSDEADAGPRPDQVGAAVDVAGKNHRAQAGGDGGDEIPLIGTEQEKFRQTDEDDEQGTGTGADQRGEGEGGEGRGEKIRAGPEGVVRGKTQKNQDKGEISKQGQQEEAQQAVADESLGQDEGKNERQNEGGKKDRNPGGRAMGGGGEQGKAVGEEGGEGKKGRAETGIGFEPVFRHGPPEQRNRRAHRVRLVWRAPRCSL